MHKMLDLITNYSDGPLSYTLGPFSNGPNVILLTLNGWAQCINKGPIAKCDQHQ